MSLRSCLFALVHLGFGSAFILLVSLILLHQSSSQFNLESVVITRLRHGCKAMSHLFLEINLLVRPSRAHSETLFPRTPFVASLSRTT